MGRKSCPLNVHPQLPYLRQIAVSHLFSRQASLPNFLIVKKRHPRNAGAFRRVPKSEDDVFASAGVLGPYFILDLWTELLWKRIVEANGVAAKDVPTNALLDLPAQTITQATTRYDSAIRIWEIDLIQHSPR